MIGRHDLVETEYVQGPQKKKKYLTYGTSLFLFFGSTVENLQITKRTSLHFWHP